MLFLHSLVCTKMDEAECKFIFHAVWYTLDSCKCVFLKVKQLKILEMCMLGNILGVLPTGYGKSVIFHMFPFMSDYLSRKGKKLAVTISPLNALIRDQVSNLNARGVKAGVLQASHRVVEDDNQRLLWAAYGWMFPWASVSKEVFMPNLNKKKNEFDWQEKRENKRILV